MLDRTEYYKHSVKECWTELNTISIQSKNDGQTRVKWPLSVSTTQKLNNVQEEQNFMTATCKDINQIDFKFGVTQLSLSLIQTTYNLFVTM